MAQEWVGNTLIEQCVFMQHYPCVEPAQCLPLVAELSKVKPLAKVDWCAQMP